MSRAALQALVDASIINRLQDCVLADLRAELPFIKTVERYNGQFDENGVKRTAGAQQAIFITALGAPSSKPEASGQRAHTVTLTAYVLSVDTGSIRRDVAAFAIAEKIAELAHFRRWTGWPGRLGHANEVKITRVASATLEAKGAALIAASWSNAVALGADQLANPEGTPAHLDSVAIGQASVRGEQFDGIDGEGGNG
ncbi:MAG: hypothetical protein JJ926_03825 [Roseitalea sp.]|nr:hypothetical protein [Roseitalea sp.]MBO6950985.1 hypothetical protein [Rhizobiaceae bacterium]MBO6591028.1 hypothetical protein [Roseitalea sp.]MBO6599714.1 hypothetical protein [Roseitalea sp.]MBO6611470.1 hypothetical protein [Roseitalea sp.]